MNSTFPAYKQCEQLLTMEQRMLTYPERRKGWVFTVIDWMMDIFNVHIDKYGEDTRERKKMVAKINVACWDSE